MTKSSTLIKTPNRVGTEGNSLSLIKGPERRHLETQDK